LQTPLTFDRKTVQTLLNESAIVLPVTNTAIGDAIVWRLNVLKNQPANSVFDPVNDGANTAGEVSP